ncbi:MAG TPA: hypothetical protein DD670_04460, partial [Planctomycetaceae bacterium]|nr:hypothetical protein [Planctomycetaceae bacterium]
MRREPYDSSKRNRWVFSSASSRNRRRCSHHRRLACEPLENRRLLAVDAGLSHLAPLEGDACPVGDMEITPSDEILDDSFEETLSSVAPSLWTKGLRHVQEGEPLTVVDIGMFTDSGGETKTFTYFINWGDGEPAATGDATIDVPGGTGNLTRGTFDGSYTYLDEGDGRYNVTLWMEDSEGGRSLDRSMTVFVHNVAPHGLAIDPIDPVDEGETVSLRGTFVDPGTLDEHAVTIDWGDGMIESVLVLPLGEREFAADHVYADNGEYTVTVTVEDDAADSDVHYAEESFAIVVSNVAPSFSVAGDQEVTVGELLEIENVAVFSDPGFNNPLNIGGEVEETFTYMINWGDGTPEQTGTVTNIVMGQPNVLTTGSLDASHTFTTMPVAGHYVVTVTIRDDDGGTATEQFLVVVHEPIAA